MYMMSVILKIQAKEHPKCTMESFINQFFFFWGGGVGQSEELAGLPTGMDRARVQKPFYMKIKVMMRSPQRTERNTLYYSAKSFQLFD